MSADNHNPSSPAGGGPDAAADASNRAPESVRTGVVASHGEREKRAYVAPVEVPRKHQRMHTIDMSKVRISPDMKVQHLDPRAMPTTKMDIPPGGIRPLPPPATAEVADAGTPSRPGGVPVGAPGGAASPWAQNAGIDRSALPSAAMAPTPSAQAARIPSMPPPMSKAPSTAIGPGVWIAVIVVAALLGGGIALALRGSSSKSGTDAASSSAPISIAVPTNPTNTDTASEPDDAEPNGDEATEDAGAPASTTKTTGPRTVPRRTSPAPKTTGAPAPAPAPTTTRPRLFN